MSSKNKETICLSSPLLSSAEAEPSTVEFYPSAFPVRRLQVGTNLNMDLGENQSVTPCELWVAEHNTTEQNWSDIQTEYLDLCVGPQRFAQFSTKSNLFVCLDSGCPNIFSTPSQWFIS